MRCKKRAAMSAATRQPDSGVKDTYREVADDCQEDGGVER